MQSGSRNTKKWLLEFDTLNTGVNPLMGWESSTDTLSEIKLEFMTKDLAILIGPSTKYLTTNQFLDEIDLSLKNKLN